VGCGFHASAVVGFDCHGRWWVSSGCHLGLIHVVTNYNSNATSTGAGPASPSGSHSPDSTSSIPVPAPDTALAAPVVRNRGPLTLTPDSGADLDSANKNWGTAGSSCEDQDITLYSAGHNTALDGACGFGKFAIVPAKAPFSYNTCANATGYVQDLPGSEVQTGIKFCVYTSEHRYALVQVQNSDPKTGGNGLNRLDLYVVTCDPPAP
jgi:hypothetical protein